MRALLFLLGPTLLSAASIRHSGGYMYSYYVPPAAGTPWRPAWSPDGKELAFSMAGSIWSMRVGESAARELTAGRTNDSSPAWSPDGRWIAYTAEDETGVNLMLLNLASGESTGLTKGGDLNLDPCWSRDGKRLAFVRNQPGGQFHIYVMSVENGRPGREVRITEPHDFGHARLYFNRNDDHIQPAWSPDGKELMLVSNRGIALGTGAIWRAPATADCMREAKMILREETLYRTQPQWSPDGRRILYSSHRGSQYNNLYLLPATGGEPYQLTHGDWDHFDARWSPDGEWIAYISNEHGISDLRLLRAVGGEERKVLIRERAYKRPMGKLSVQASDPARWYLIASDGKTYVPDGAYQRVPGRAGHGDFFHAGKQFTIELPAGEAILEAVKGIEYDPLERRVVVKPHEVTSIAVTMRRASHMNAEGWYSGSDHTHMNYGGNLHNTPANMMFMAEAEDLNVIAAKIANKDNRILDWQYFTGRPHSLSTSQRILRFDEEYRPPFYGHINVINLNDHLISPFITGYEQTAFAGLYPSNTDIFQAAHAEGGIGGYVHPWSREPEKAQYAVARGFASDLALGSFEYLEVLTRAGHFTHTSEVWHRALNCGFKIAASAGEDSILGMHATPILGQSRVYVHVGTKLTWDAWIEGIRHGRTFVTNGPLLNFHVNGETPGAEIHLPEGGGTLDVSGKFDSIVPVDRMELYLNGKVLATVRSGSKHGELRQRVPMNRSGWLTLRAISNSPHHPVEDPYVVAETSPVYVYCGQEPIRSRADAEYFLRWVDDVARQAEADPSWNSDRERRHVLDQFAAARRIFEQRIKEAKQ